MNRQISMNKDIFSSDHKYTDQKSPRKKTSETHTKKKQM